MKGWAEMDPQQAIGVLLAQLDAVRINVDNARLDFLAAGDRYDKTGMAFERAVLNTLEPYWDSEQHRSPVISSSALDGRRLIGGFDAGRSNLSGSTAILLIAMNDAILALTAQALNAGIAVARPLDGDATENLRDALGIVVRMDDLQKDFSLLISKAILIGDSVSQVVSAATNQLDDRQVVLASFVQAVPPVVPPSRFKEGFVGVPETVFNESLADVSEALFNMLVPAGPLFLLLGRIVSDIASRDAEAQERYHEALAQRYGRGEIDFLLDLPAVLEARDQTLQAVVSGLNRLGDSLVGGASAVQG